jgi:hypothetical protein
MSNHIIFNVTDEAADVVSDVHDHGNLGKACAELRTRVRDGLVLETSAGRRKNNPNAFGATAVWPLGPIDVSKQRAGEPRQTSSYYCPKVGKYFRTIAECHKNCPKPPPNPNKEPVDPCGAPQSTVTVSYHVTRSYTVRINYRVFKFQLQPRIETMPSAKRVIAEWNAAVLAHELRHVDDAKTIAEQTLPEKTTYAGHGADEMAADDDVFAQIHADDLKIKSAFTNALKVGEVLFHTAHGAQMPYPNLCPPDSH